MAAICKGFEFLEAAKNERAQFALSRCGADVASKETWQGAVTPWEHPGGRPKLRWANTRPIFVQQCFLKRWAIPSNSVFQELTLEESFLIWGFSKHEHIDGINNSSSNTTTTRTNSNETKCLVW